MKQYSKPQMMAKNAPTGSYAAGCPTYNSQKKIGGGISNAGLGNPNTFDCKQCEVSK